MYMCFFSYLDMCCFVIFWVSRVYLGLNLSFPWYQHGPSKNQHVLVRSSSHCWHRSWGRSTERHQMRVERRVVWTRRCHRPARWGTADVIKLGRGFVRFLCKINWNDNLQWYLSLIKYPNIYPNIPKEMDIKPCLSIPIHFWTGSRVQGAREGGVVGCFKGAGTGSIRGQETQ